ncbi:MAG: hypothetical protein LC800_06730 [Acidobacteria bacterium]|nr:hypothetical protein [Acidobacteriota bacterium]
MTVPSLRVLITNHSLAARAGTQLFVLELAAGLKRRGHTPAVYSPELGPLAREIEGAGVRVTDDLGALDTPPDIIHGQHHTETVAALLRYGDAPALFYCHGARTWPEAPPTPHPRLLRYAAVDEPCRERLVGEHGVPGRLVSVILNSVDLSKFKPRGPLPARPRRALVFSNNAAEATYVGEVRAACARAGLELDVAGLGAGRATVEPERLLPRYDLVFAKARCALEALAVGAAVILCDEGGAGPLVTAAELEALRRLNFGARTLTHKVSAAALAREMGRYDPADAAEVTRRVRAAAGQEAALDQIVALYEAVIAEHGARARDAEAEALAAAGYLRWLSLEVRRERELLFNSPAARLHRALLRGAPPLGPLGALRRKLKGRKLL